MIKQKYNATRIQLLYQMLVSSQQQGHLREYDIKVDELKVVQRTGDPEQFFRHEEFILPDTQTVTITFYEGSSNRNTRHVFVLREPDDEKQQKTTLDGIEQLFEEKMSKQKQQWNLELLEKENASLKEQLKDSEEYAEQLEAEFTALKEKKFDTGKNIGVILSGALESLVRNNTSLLKRIPGGQALAGLIEDDNKRLEVSAGDEVVASRETAASFKRKSSQGNRGVEDEININNVEKQSAETGLDALLVYQLQQLQQVIPPGDNRDKLHSILQVFAGNPHLIIDVWGLFDEACRQQAFHEVTKQNNTVHTGTNANESTGTQTSSDSGKEQLNKKRL